MKNNKATDVIVVGFAIFATFFGAGNIIFPSALGFSVGEGWSIATLGFLFSGIVLPVLAIVSVGSNEGSFENITDKVSKIFSKIILLSIMVFILGLVGLPRIGAVTYELGINPLLPGVNRIAVSLVFYSITVYFAINPANVVDKIGKILTPVLILILFVIIGKGIVSPIDYPAASEISTPFTVGFFTGYEVGDAFGGVVIASLFTAAVAAKGYTESRELSRMTIYCTVLGGTLLFLVYGGLIYIGATGSLSFPADIGRTALLAGLVEALLGKAGLAALSVAVVFACLTTSVGLSSAIANYFTKVSKGRLAYRNAILGINLVAGIYSILGVETIMKVAIPILLVFYPGLIVLIIMGLFSRLIPGRGAYIGATYTALVVSVLSTASMYGFNVVIVNKLPLAAYGFAWVVPAIAGMVAGLVVERSIMNRRKAEEDVCVK